MDYAQSFMTSCLISGVGTVQDFGPGSGPIFLENLGCESSQERILSCSRQSPIGIHQCTHAMDVGVDCPGEWNVLAAVCIVLLVADV